MDQRHLTKENCSPAVVFGSFGDEDAPFRDIDIMVAMDGQEIGIKTVIFVGVKGGHGQQ